LHTVHVRVNDAATGLPTPVRIRFVDSDGKYLAPLGRLADPPTGVGEDVGGNLLLDDDRYAYIDGTCEIQLPADPVTVELLKGLEYKPLRQEIALGPGKLTLRLAIERWTDWRADGWYSGDTRAHFLSPHAALLEGAAEDLAVVNLLAFESRRHDRRTLPGILEFSGQRCVLETPGHLVAVNTLNEHPRLGSLGLLHSHRPVFPLRFGDPDSFDDWSLADWCDQCHRKGGLVVWTKALSGGEALADLILERVDALEATSLGSDTWDIVSTYYRLLNAGFHVPLAGASGKKSNARALGNVRTYARLRNGEDFSYKTWIEAIRAGRTFVTNGPLLSFSVNGEEPGSRLTLSDRASLRVSARAQSAWPFERLEILANGDVVADVEAAPGAKSAVLDTEVEFAEGGWLAARCHASATRIGCAHTSPVYVRIEGRPPRFEKRALDELRRDLEQTARWIDRDARCPSQNDRFRLRGILQDALELLRKRTEQAV
jgi:hypothetical protein